jgi:hypothetical protein
MIRRCDCGATPKFQKGQRAGIRTLQLTCACGNRGATLMYTRREDEQRMRQAGIDGWNLSC